VSLPQPIHVAIFSLLFAITAFFLTLGQRLGEWRSRKVAHALAVAAGCTVLCGVYLASLWLFNVDLRKGFASVPAWLLVSSLGMSLVALLVWLVNRDIIRIGFPTAEEKRGTTESKSGHLNPNSPYLEISNGSNILLPGWKNVPVGAVTITNTARKSETVARGVKANVTFRQAGKGFTINGMEWWLNMIGTTKATRNRSPDISSMSDYEFILPLFFVADHRHYRAWYGSGPEKVFPPYDLALGEWQIEINIEDSNGLKWKQIVTVLLTNNAEPKW
jgi:hypothetical protein